MTNLMRMRRVSWHRMVFEDGHLFGSVESSFVLRILYLCFKLKEKRKPRLSSVIWVSLPPARGFCLRLLYVQASFTSYPPYVVRHVVTR